MKKVYITPTVFFDEVLDCDELLILSKEKSNDLTGGDLTMGDGTKIQGVNFDRLAAKFEAEVASTTDKGAIEVYLDDPTKASNYVCSVNVKNTGSKENFTTVSTDITSAVGGKHDVYFVFRGTDYNVASWRFTGSGDPLPTAVPATPAPTIVPAATPAPGSEHKFDIANDNYYVEGGDGVRVIKNDDNTVTLKFTKQYSAVDMYLPENSDFYNNCKSVVITYKLSGNVKKSDGTPDSNLGHALFDKDCVPNPSGYGDASKGKHVDWGQKLAVTDTYVTKVFRVGNDFSGNCVNGIQIFNPHTMSSGNEINITIKSVRFYPDEKADNFVPSEDDPAKTPAPTKAPDVAPTKAPDVAPTKAPEAEPTKAPEAASTKAPEAKPTTTPTISTINNVENLKKTYLIGKLKYKMMDSRYVAVTGVEKKNIKAVSVPATVKISGKTYKIVKMCRKHKKIAIVATEMLESMKHNPRPTRAEVNDVANAVYDRTGAIMLSGESAMGKHPDLCVKTMDKISNAVESDINYWKRFENKTLNMAREDIKKHVAYIATATAKNLNADAIVVYTNTGDSARNLAGMGPECPILAITDNKNTYYQLGLSWNVFPILVEGKATI